MANTPASPDLKGAKHAARPTGGTRVHEIKRPTVEIVVFSSAIIVHAPVRHTQDTQKGNNSASSPQHYVQELWEEARKSREAAGDYFDDKTSNPGHVAMRIGDTIYDYGRYGEHGIYFGEGILSKDNFQKELASHLRHCRWIYGFEVVVESRENIEKAIDDVWTKGEPRPNSNKPQGRKIGEYDLATNSCKTFTQKISKRAELRFRVILGF